MVDQADAVAEECGDRALREETIKFAEQAALEERKMMTAGMSSTASSSVFIAVIGGLSLKIDEAARFIYLYVRDMAVATFFFPAVLLFFYLFFLAAGAIWTVLGLTQIKLKSADFYEPDQAALSIAEDASHDPWKARLHACQAMVATNRTLRQALMRKRSQDRITTALLYASVACLVFGMAAAATHLAHR
ncbi:hypothetical protein [Tanticharoenia sakaeratensis]|uniref:Uncharacterized protein n=1 Tax=Tanticharoenia sakaeratensis NBRC 103193 TaxID=1231623 RepID=A0A0D6MKI5_9PROT|nr:hypothetical protein [Tanticharoenia sakaeratensis]GAN53763.1 hypothetical protein Tasa_010_310 [Tanticharoenia sakaeratensis NBRC 103193]GBQ16984.1 hypothetical protein AA103193_0176 [Tanticharoenia sakaeratensis NBRC 103193]